MNADWMTTPTGRLVLHHGADPRPAWLWSVDGQTLLWSNPAAALFLAKLKKHGIKYAPLAVPIKGQLARIARLGGLGRTSLSRVQFLAGDKPASTTCACTPLHWLDGQTAMLIVGVDRIAPELLAEDADASALPQQDQTQQPIAEAALLPEQVAGFTIDTPAEWPSATPVDQDISTQLPQLQVLDTAPVPEEGTPTPDIPADAPEEAQAWPGAEQAATDWPSSEPEEIVVLPEPENETSGGNEAAPTHFEPPTDAPAHAQLQQPYDSIGAVIVAEQDAAADRELSAWHAEHAADGVTDTPDSVGAAPATRLSGLFDRMVNNAGLYTPLTDADDVMLGEPPADAANALPTLYRIVGQGFIAGNVAPTDAGRDVADVATLDGDGGLQPDVALTQAPQLAQQGETLAAEQLLALAEQERLNDEGAPLPEVAAAQAPEFAEQAATLEAGQSLEGEEQGGLDDEGAPVPEIARERAAEFGDQADILRMIDTPVDENALVAVPDAEAVERVSRYNFDELSRILTDRVGDAAAPSSSVLATAPGNSGALINLGGETLVLNRLPLGIMVFRDQQVLFANRAITEMVGYDSVEQLRSAGLAGIFPAMGSESQEAGPVNHLVQRDGSLVPVTARLQSISWQGRPALMLSASATEVRTGHEAAVRAFAQAFAEVRHDGYFETNRAGIISANNGEASALLGGGPGDLVGRALAGLIDGADQAEFKAFLERPARFAETARPAITVSGTRAGVEIQLFAQGQAGIVSGYFGFAHRSAGGARAAAAQLGGGEPEPALLARISRGVRRPLNTIIGFSDMIRSEAFGALQNQRYEAYAEDIRTAGHEIAALVDELDDYARLKDGRYLPQRASIELGALLESCVQRVRRQAGAARVIVRSAISEKLPRITADRASLAQAVLNLLASAIDQTPTGGAVVISAQAEDDGAIGIHVRDSATTTVDMAERFVVFRDGVGRDGQALNPVRSSVGLALTRSLLAVNAFSLTVDPAGEQGMLFSLLIPADLVDYPPQY